MKGSLKHLPQHGRYAGGPSGIVGKSSLASEEVKKLQQDLALISARLSQGNPASSSVVGDLRSTVADARSSSESLSAPSKVELLDDILKKVSELDRSILKKTEPVLAEGARPRRNSNTMDLFCIPTHFQIIDRLVDLHTQSKRPVIVHQHGAAAAGGAQAGASAARDAEVAALKAKHDAALSAMSGSLQAVQAKLATAEKKSQESMAEAQRLLAENSKLKSENTKLSTENVKLTADNTKLKADLEAQSRESAAPAQEHPELASMTRKYNEAVKNGRALEERVECAAGSEQLACNAMLKLAKNIQDDKSLGTVQSYFAEGGQTSRYVESFGRLLTAVTDRVDAFKLDLIACTTNMQLLENELSSMKLEKQMLVDDYNSMTVSFNSLRVAFSEMESESIQLRVRLESKEKVAKEGNADAVEKALLTFRTTANAEIERLQKSLSDMETIMSEREREVSRYNSHIAMLEQELQEYKDLTDKLKKKIRDITPLDKRELLDSFEEVMQDEMMTMKAAFENKLKMAKSELETLSKKHQNDIQRIKESSSVKKIIR